MNRILVFLLVAGLAAAGGPRIFYSIDHPGARPPHVQITVDRNGHGGYRENVNDPGEKPIQFQLRPGEVEQIFALAAKLDYFRRPLESHLKVANMGLKTLRYTDGATTGEQKFNYSKDADAQLLADWFARIAESEQHWMDLKRTAQFEKLGINKVLLQIQVAVERHRLVAPDQFLPLLDKIVRDTSYLHMARRRAAALAEYIRAPAEKIKK